MVEQANRCVSCGTSYPATKRVCVRCGIDLKTGLYLDGHIKPEDEQPEAELTRMQAVADLARQLLPGLSEPLLAALSAAGLILSSVISWYALWALREMEITGGAAMIGLALVINAQAMAWIVTGELQSLVNALVDMGDRMPYFLALTVLPFFPLAVLNWMFLSAGG
jgi:hypothetical protein